MDSSSLPQPDRRAAWWAWPVILLVPLLLIIAERFIPAAEEESGGQQDLSLLALLQVQAKVLIAMDSAPGTGDARKELRQLEDHVRDDETAGAVAVMHGFLGLEDGGREAVELVLANRRKDPGADKLFLASVEDAALNGVDESGRAKLRERLGWFADLPGVPGEPENVPEGARLRSNATLLVMLLGLAMFAGFLAVLTGAALLLYAVISRGSGRLRLAFDSNQAPAGVFLESFAIFLATMALGNIGGWTLHWVLQPVFSLGGLALALAWPKIRVEAWRDTRRSMGWTRGRGIFREIGAGFVGYIVMLPMAVIGIAMTALLIALSSLFKNGGGDSATMATPEPVTHPIVGWMLGGWEVKLLAFVFAAILAPVIEETFFRGQFFRHLRSKTGLFVAGMLNGLIFASLHPQGWLAIPALTMMGFGFACIREWRDSLIAPMTAHAINNGLLVAGLALALS
jgi:membrane protease YdiL (CAAX protease family)